MHRLKYKQQLTEESKRIFIKYLPVPFPIFVVMTIALFFLPSYFIDLLLPSITSLTHTLIFIIVWIVYVSIITGLMNAKYKKDKGRHITQDMKYKKTL